MAATGREEIVSQQQQRQEYGGVDGKDYTDPPPEPVVATSELRGWSLYRAAIAEFVATLLFLYVTVATVIGHKRSQSDSSSDACGGVGISGRHINPAVTFALLLARKVSLPRAALYVVAQCLGAVCGVALVRAVHSPPQFTRHGGGANVMGDGYGWGTGFAAEVVGTFVLVYTVFSATDAKHSANGQSHSGEW
ncbi:hypothetical protein PR202_ga00536 [Eleusine coracana subsp. coracana]|uniref:Uncharacterized protein n=1 Tax=Eleusine coracana subsp. coracana TaxID=191504 RepID=A0AAV5BFT4_ELECO|nr:hypothetical protein PR202_ga00536 [Eleusine coracana subsp. coracana]